MSPIWTDSSYQMLLFQAVITGSDVDRMVGVIGKILDFLTTGLKNEHHHDTKNS